MSGVHVADVEIRSWPERTDVLVIDYRKARVIAQYPLGLADTPANQAAAPYDKRAAFVVDALEADQPLLHIALDLDAAHEVRLNPVEDCRARMNALLAEYGLSLDAIAVERLPEAIAALDALDVTALWRLLCEWHDVVELHYPAGSSAARPACWVHRAHPERAHHYLLLACGLRDYADADEADADAAYEMFCDLVDVPSSEFHFGLLLRWVFFHRTEFADRERRPLRALTELFA